MFASRYRFSHRSSLRRYPALFLLYLAIRGAVVATPCYAGPPMPRSGVATGQLVNALAAHAIGPSEPSGRVVDVAVVQDDSKRIFVATATGGLWKTVDQGSYWSSIFE